LRAAPSRRAWSRTSRRGVSLWSDAAARYTECHPLRGRSLLLRARSAARMRGLLNTSATHTAASPASAYLPLGPTGCVNTSQLLRRNPRAGRSSGLESNAVPPRAPSRIATPPRRDLPALPHSGRLSRVCEMSLSPIRSPSICGSFRFNRLIVRCHCPVRLPSSRCFNILGLAHRCPYSPYNSVGSARRSSAKGACTRRRARCPPRLSHRPQPPAFWARHNLRL